MKIVIIGGTGTIGKHVTKAFKKDHEVIAVGSKSGDLQVDITSAESIRKLFDKTGKFDALVSATGSGHFGPFDALTEKEFRKGVDSKLMGQINLVLIGQHHINYGGSFTLTSGILAQEPIPSGAAVSAVNGALDSFARAAAIELKNGVRINSVSPGVVEDSPNFFSFFPGHIPVSMERVTQAYVKSVLGGLTGQVFRVV